jgi:uncharacterized repeat protein (TIGR01451 family)/fimbrial isopeptide formation D2 family protein
MGGVTVGLYDGSGSPLSTTVTAGDGSFSFTGLTPGDYSLEFTVPGAYLVSPPAQGGDAARDSDADPSTGRTPETTLVSGENDPRWDLGLYQNASLGDLVWEDRNANGRQDPGEPGIEGVGVELRSGAGSLLDSAATAADGRYTFTDLVPGDYYIQFTKPAGTTISSMNAGPDRLVDSDADPATGRTVTTTLGSGETDPGWDLGLYQVVQLSGKVWYDVDGDGTQDSGEPPIPGIALTLTWAGLDGNPATPGDNSTLPPATTAADGTWSLAGATPGVYQAVASALPDGLTQATYDLDGAGTPSQAQFPVSSGQSRSDIDFGYRGAGSIGNFAWSDLDHDGVQDAGEPGLAGVTVALTWAGPDGDLATPGDNLVYADLTTLAGGLYTFDHLPGGQFRLSASLPDGVFFTALQAGSDPAADSDFDPQSGQTTAITLPDGASDLTLDLGVMRHTITKAVSATSFAPTAGTAVTIGEVVTYDIALTFPEGSSADTLVVDALPAGLEYVEGSATLLLDGFDGSALLGTVTAVPGQVSFDLGTVVVNSGAAGPAHGLLLRFDARVRDVPGNSGVSGSQTSLANTASLQVDSGPVVASNPVILQVVEPRLTLEKTFNPTSASLGETITIYLAVENNGTSPAYDLILTDPLLDTRFTDITEDVTPPGFTFSAVSVGGTTTVRYTAGAGTSLPAGGRLSFAFQAAVAATVSPGSVLPNTAEISQAATLPGPDDHRRLEPVVSASANLPTVGADLALVKTAAPDPVTAGETLAYTLDVTNLGPYPASQVRVVDVLEAGMTFVSAEGDIDQPWSCAYAPAARQVDCLLDDLPVDDTTTITLVVAVSSGALGPLENTATVSSGLLDPDLANNQDSTSTVVTAAADLSILKTGAAQQFAGTDLVYSLAVANHGPSDALSVSVSDLLPAGVSLRSVTYDSGHPWSCSGTATVICDLPALAAGDTSTITLTVRIAVEASGSLDNTAAVSTTTLEPNYTNNASTVSTTVLPAPYLASSKLAAEVDGNGVITPGEVLEYTIAITNTGQSDAEAVLFTDTPGEHTTLIAGTVTSDAPGSTVTRGNAPGDTSVAIQLGTLPALTGSATLTFRVRIDTPLPVGVNSVSNQGVFEGSNFQPVTTDNHAGPHNPGEPTVTYVNGTPRLAAIKSALLVVDPDLNLTASPGDTLEYAITVTNTGDAADSAVVFTDTLDPNTTLVAGSVETSQGSVTLGNAAGDTAVAVDLGTLPGAGGQAVVTFRARINPSLPAGTDHLRNQGAVDGQATHILTDDPQTVDPDDATLTPVMGPTAVTLLEFRAVPWGRQQVKLEWSTAVEVNNYGFILKRAAVDDYQQAAAVGFVPSAVPGGSGGGAAYQYIDTPPEAGEWVYWLVDLDMQGQQTPHSQTVTADTSPDPRCTLFMPFVIK